MNQLSSDLWITIIKLKFERYEKIVFEEWKTKIQTLNEEYHSKVKYRDGLKFCLYRGNICSFYSKINWRPLCKEWLETYRDMGCGWLVAQAEREMAKLGINPSDEEGCVRFVNSNVLLYKDLSDDSYSSLDRLPGRYWYSVIPSDMIE